MESPNIGAHSPIAGGYRSAHSGLSAWRSRPASMGIPTNHVPHRRYAPPVRNSTIQTPDGKEVGQHHGLMYYTLGQREGLGIGGRQDSGDEPWYVADKNLHENVLVVVQGEHPLLYSSALEASHASWIGTPPASELHCMVKIRYRQPDQACDITLSSGGKLLVTFEEEQRAVAPGQFAVFYEGERCMGGAVIDRAFSHLADVREAI